LVLHSSSRIERPRSVRSPPGRRLPVGFRTSSRGFSPLQRTQPGEFTSRNRTAVVDEAAPTRADRFHDPKVARRAPVSVRRSSAVRCPTADESVVDLGRPRSPSGSRRRRDRRGSPTPFASAGSGRGRCLWRQVSSASNPATPKGGEIRSTPWFDSSSRVPTPLRSAFAVLHGLDGFPLSEPSGVFHPVTLMGFGLPSEEPGGSSRAWRIEIRSALDSRSRHDFDRSDREVPEHLVVRPVTGEPVSTGDVHQGALVLSVGLGPLPVAFTTDATDASSSCRNVTSPRGRSHADMGRSSSPPVGAGLRTEVRNRAFDAYRPDDRPVDATEG